MSYFKITCARGHNGSGNSPEITFAIEAPNLMSAVNIARNMPSVKHTAMPLSTAQIEYDEYVEMRAVSAYERAGNAGVQRKARYNERHGRHGRGR